MTIDEMAAAEGKAGVFVAVPCQGMLHVDFVACLINLLVHEPDRRMVLNLRESPIVHRSRNSLVRSFLSFETHPMDYIMWIDSDMVFRPTDMHMLLETDKDIIGGLYGTRKAPFRPTAGYCNDATGWDLRAIDDWDGGIKEVDYVGFGFVLVKRRVLEQLGVPCFVHRQGRMADHRSSEYGEDISFCLSARDAGFRVHVHTGVRLGHIGRCVYTMADVEAYGRMTASQQGTPNERALPVDHAQRVLRSTPPATQK